MPIIGTAGHVDHGKSTLVLALTGTDPDRLAEEKRRGMTIDLGFAHLELPRGGSTGIVDVPGHARFLHNMLAGVHGMDVVLLVVAADEGVMPQTREHLDIIQLLGVQAVVVALTKVDRVDPDLLELAEADVRGELEGRGIPATVVTVSAPRRQGLEELIAALDGAVVGATVTDRGLARLPVDRAFTMAGFGTVVTGTLVDGALSVGQQLEVMPGPGGKPRRVRVRGLQQHGHPVAEALPGSRVAANLQGIDHDVVGRGMVLAPPGTLRQTARLDGRVRVLPGSSGLRHNSRVRVHTGTTEVAARVVLLEAGEAAGDDNWVQLRLAAPIALREGDRFIIRRLSPSETLGGGEVIDATAALHRRGDAAAVAALNGRSDNRARVLQEVGRGRGGASVPGIATGLSLAPAEVEMHAADLVAAGDVALVGSTLWEAQAWTALGRRARLELQAFHGRNPLRPGMAAEELRERLGLRGRGAGEALEALAAAGVVTRREHGALSLPGWEPSLSEPQQRFAESLVARLGADPLAPPRASELGGGRDDLVDVCQFLEERGRLVRLGPDLWVLRDAVEAAGATLEAHLREVPSVTVAEARDVLGSSRKVVVPLLEHFDAVRLTVRDGDVRRLRKATAP
ncbi:MAG: selenocysteine-specific translation elongation factor [Candidatus Dormibacteria bacterium]